MIPLAIEDVLDYLCTGFDTRCTNGRKTEEYSDQRCNDDLNFTIPSSKGNCIIYKTEDCILSAGDIPS
jgi:hypothetical protein